ncbi:FHA domain-containing protein [Chamaesiphon minutus]|uniref:FHA domain-containing protein n=1 Tax=Chamaesiphon minutus (strain ATCC 27169 / PCC 6605) TaxID=1173020 RepID=K9UHD8_CHAP6|nr:FHA domain-containing protein [Chamaesiphon minutus]AFY93846.1 FHA domain-containing protein [Chamaesiphon minutus PCC 6605]
MYTCPKGHNSTESDFCSECGAKITGMGIAEVVSNPTHKTAATINQSVAVQSCPECSTPHEVDSGNFCEICGFNFLTGAKGGDPLSIFPPPIRSGINTTATAPTQPPHPSAQVTNPAPNAVSQWQVIISIDPSLATPDSPPAPAQEPIVIELTQPTNLIGRTSIARAIHPEIPLDLDDAVSSRHAILTLHPDGTLILRDIGSSNGTLVNGKEIAVMADISIASGDEITLGHWTRIKLINLNSGRS